MQIRKVLVPIDFSPSSKVALNHGIAFARSFRSELTLLHVIDSTALAYTFPSETTRFESKRAQQVRTILQALAPADLPDHVQVQVVVTSGNIEDQILSTIYEQETDLLVMGTRGRGLVSRLLIGSVTESMLRKVKVPMLTVCGNAPVPSFDRILFATDLSEESKREARFAIELAQMKNARLIALHAVDEGNLRYAGFPIEEDTGRNLLDEARGKLDEFEALAACQRVKTETIVARGPAAEAILKTAETNSVDLIMMTVGKKGLLERTLLGSTAEHVVREAHIPVLSIPTHRIHRTQEIPDTRAA